jgi:hypothetical protein
MDNDQQQGAGVTTEQRTKWLAELRQIAEELGCTTAEAAYIKMREMVSPLLEFSEMYMKADIAGKGQTMAMLKGLQKRMEDQTE